MREKNKTFLNRTAALGVSLLMLTSAVACNKDNTKSETDKPDSSVADSAVSQTSSVNPSKYDIKTPALEKTAVPDGFSVAPIQSGDPNFVPGSLYKGAKLTFRKSTDGKEGPAVGMWVWDCRMIKGTSPDSDISSDMMLDMFIQNGVTEIYMGMQYYTDLETQIAAGGVKEGFVSEMELRGFIKKCSKYGIRVAMLTTMVDNTYSQMERKEDEAQEYRATKRWVNMIADFNSRASGDDEKLYGVHIDLEPDWENGGSGLEINLQNCADYLIRMRKYCDFYNVELTFDIHAFFEENWKAYDENGNYVNIIDIFTKQCRQLTLMSYRRTAEGQYELGEFELPFAAKNGCQLILGAELGDTSEMPPAERNISYYPMGAKYFINQQNKLREMLDKSGCKSFGIALHHAAPYYIVMTEKP